MTRKKIPEEAPSSKIGWKIMHELTSNLIWKGVKKGETLLDYSIQR
jgi:hypothetical protein